MEFGAKLDQAAVPASDNFTQQILCKTGLPIRTSTLGGPVSVIRKDRQARAIQLKIAGLSYSAIAKELGITRQRVQQMVRPSVQTVHLLRLRAKDHCEKCGELATGHGAHIHHVQRREDYNALENLLYLCNPCHRKEHSSGDFLFTHLPPKDRRPAAEAFIQPYLAHIAQRYCCGCGTPKAVQGLCNSCRNKSRSVNRIKAALTQWKRGTTKTAYHCLTQAIYDIRRLAIRPEDLAPRRVL